MNIFWQLIMFAVISVIANFIVQYISRKGENLATKQDIEKITRKIETVKNEISFENQRKHTFVEERKAMFLNVLKLAEEVLYDSNILLFFLRDTTAHEEMGQIVKNTNSKIVDLQHESRMILVAFEDKEIRKQVLVLTSEVAKFAMFVSTTAMNARSTMMRIKTGFDLYEKHPGSDVSDMVKEAREQLDRIVSEYEKEKTTQWKPVEEEIKKYLSVLHKLFKMQFHIKTDLAFSE